MSPVKTDDLKFSSGFSAHHVTELTHQSDAPTFIDSLLLVFNDCTVETDKRSMADLFFPSECFYSQRVKCQYIIKLMLRCVLAVL